MDTVTTIELHDAFSTAIRGIEPRFEHRSSQTWHHTPGGRDTEIEGDPLRNFFLVFTPGVPTYLWSGGEGTAYKCWVGVVTSYARLDPTIIEHMRTADLADLHRTLSALRDPTLPGLADVALLSQEKERLDADENIVVTHRFECHWHQATY